MVAPVVLVLIMLISTNKKVMGDRVNHPFTSFLGWLVTGIMIVAGIATIYALLT